MLQMPDQLDASQQAVVDAVQRFERDVSIAQGGVAVLGAPGTGKTVTAIAAVANCWHIQPGSAILLTPQRRSAARIKPVLAPHLPDAYQGTPVRTPASLAFDIVRQGSMTRGTSAPRLLTGAEQDQLLADIIAERSRLGDEIWPAHIDAETRSLAAFRNEVRDFIATATALRLTPEQIGMLKSERWGATWRPLGDLYAEYIDVKNAVYGVAFDVNELMLQASWELTHTSATESILDALQCLVIDDAQEATIGLPTLLAPIINAGVHLVTFGDPDASVGRFQGAQPMFATQLHDSVQVPAQAQYILSTEYRFDGNLTALAGDVVNSIGVVAGVQHRHPTSTNQLVGGDAKDVAGGAEHGTVQAISVSAQELVRSLAVALREQHYLNDVPWSELAIIARSQGTVQYIEAQLGALGLPTRGVGALVPRQESASSVLLDAAALACGIRSAQDVLDTLATSFLGDLSTVDLRRLMRWLRITELHEGGRRTGRELLIEWLDSGTCALSPEQRLVRRFQKFVDTLQHARRLLAEGATCEELLWELWDRAHVAEQWQRMALGRGTDAAIANRSLDAVLALFQSAQRFVEQSPDRPAAEWIRRMIEQPLPEDVIGVTDNAERITIATPSSVQGMSFDVVVLTDLSTGVWPNFRLRDSLLGAAALVEYVQPDQAGGTSRRDVLHDELRLLYYAITRAKKRLVLFDIESTDTEPSAFADVVKAFASPSAAVLESGNEGASNAAVDSVAARDLKVPEPAGQGSLPVTRSLHGERSVLPASLAAFTGEQRRRLLWAFDHDDPVSARESAMLLRQLMAANIDGAAPAEWQGLLAVSTPAPRETEIKVSPSSLERFETCQLAWVVDQLGGNRSMEATNFGTLLHHALEEYVRAEVPIDETVREGWSQLVFNAPYEDMREQQQAQVMIGHLNEYLRKHEHDEVAAEIKFEYTVDGVPVRGIIDRIERAPDGTVRVVDLKTGTRAPTVAEADTNAQLGCYQLALLAPDGLGGDEVMHPVIVAMDIANAPKGDPILLYVRTDAVHAKVRKQTVFDAEQAQAMATRITEAAAHMGDPILEAAVSTHCADDTFSRRCMMMLTPAVSE